MFYISSSEICKKEINFFRLPENIDSNFTEFIEKIFRKKENRPTAKECLKLGFLQKQNIPAIRTIDPVTCVTHATN